MRSRITWGQFLRRFSRAERAALRAKRQTDPMVADFCEQFELDRKVDPDSQFVVDFLNYLSGVTVDGATMTGLPVLGANRSERIRG